MGDREPEQVKVPDLSRQRSDADASQVTLEDQATLSVKDLMKHAPIEDEAEAAIQRAIEEQNPTSETSSKEKLIFAHVEDDGSAVHKFDVEDASAPPKNKTAENLFDLTNQLRGMQSGGPAIFEMNHQVRPGMSNSDMFASHAQMLMKRAQSKKSNAPEEATEQPKSDFDPKAKWRKLKAGVHVSAAAKAIAKQAAAESISHDIEAQNLPEDDDRNNGKDKKGISSAYQKFKDEFVDFGEWLKFSRKGVFTYLKFVLLYLIIPCTGIAALLFYQFENPPCGTQRECVEAQNDGLSGIVNVTGERADTIREFFSGRSESASISWWLLFLGVRQVITFTFALAAQGYIIDFLAMRTRWFVKLFGSFFTLLVVQSRGWPFTIFAWGCFDFLLLYGDGKFARHWLYFLDKVDLFNDTNPSGGIPNSEEYKKMLIIFVVVGIVVAIKRFWIGLYLGRQTFLRYANDLKTVIRKAIVVGQISALGRDMDKYAFQLRDLDIEHSTTFQNSLHANAEEDANGANNEEGSVGPQSFKSMRTIASNIDFSTSQRTKINELLGAWEEPTIGDELDQDVHISSIIQFRQSLSTLNNPMPFSVAFGPADTREKCIQNAQKLYMRLRASHPERPTLSFDALALLAIQSDGSLEQEKLKELIRLFRPDREGNLTLLDFVKSVDAIYKELRTLRAAVANSGKIDKAFEGIINILFFFFLGCIVLSAVGVDPFVLFASISGFILGFAFMIGAACSKLFEGILFILLRRPYDIGDRINISNPLADTPATGSPGWIVKDVTLFTTTVLYAASNEVATYFNGAIAAGRVINCNRSPNAALWFTLKFPLEAEYRKYGVFYSAIEKFCKDRPREWNAFLAFRAIGAAADLGYVEYIVFCTHREPWSNIGACKASLAELQSFCLELQKKMNMRYVSPPMPVHLTMGQKLDPSVFKAESGSSFAPPSPSRGGDGIPDLDETMSYGSHDVNAVASMFEKKKT